jgi:hypothetical protein
VRARSTRPETPPGRGARCAQSLRAAGCDKPVYECHKNCQQRQGCSEVVAPGRKVIANGLNVPRPVLIGGGRHETEYHDVRRHGSGVLDVDNESQRIVALDDCTTVGEVRFESHLCTRKQEQPSHSTFVEFEYRTSCTVRGGAADLHCLSLDMLLARTSPRKGEIGV